MRKVQLEVVAPATDLHATVKRALEQSRPRAALDYNKLAERYNAAAPGTVILFQPGVGYKLYNIKRVLGNRGLVLGKDAVVEWLKRDKHGSSIPVRDRPVAISKLIASYMRVI